MLSHVDPPPKSAGLKGIREIAIYMNESGLYCLISGSDADEAKVFKHWVTHEVPPQIRKTGSYKSRYDYWRSEAELGTTVMVTLSTPFRALVLFVIPFFM